MIVSFFFYNCKVLKVKIQLYVACTSWWDFSGRREGNEKMAVLGFRRSFVGAYAPPGRQSLRADNTNSNEANCQPRP